MKNGMMMQRTSATENGTAEYMEEDFDHKPTVDEIKGIIIGWYNSNIDTEIVSGFVWNDTSVWLSTENQFNYKTAFVCPASIQGGGKPCRTTADYYNVIHNYSPP